MNRKMKSNARVRHGHAALAGAVLATSAATMARAADLSVDTTSTVSTDSSYGSVWVGNTGTGVLTSSGPTLNVGTALVVGNAADATGTLNLSSAAQLNASGAAVYVGNAGRGTVNAFNTSAFLLGSGSLYLGNSSTGVGTLLMSGGTITQSGGTGINVVVGVAGTGTFNQTGGTIALGNSFNSLNLGNASTGVGTYLMSGAASLTAYNVSVGYLGTGTFNITGGSFTPRNLILGTGTNAQGTFLQSGSATTTTVGTVYLGNTSSPTPSLVSITGGKLIATGAIDIGYFTTSSNGVLNVSGGSTAVNVGATMYVGYQGAGALNLDAATFNVSTNAILAYASGGSTGTANLSNGATLNVTGAASLFEIANLGRATLNQGTNATINYASSTTVQLGNASTGVGVWNLNGGAFNASLASVSVGNAGTGTIAQSAGTFNAANGSLTLGVNATGNGTYNLSGSGVLLVKGINVGNAGTGAFNQIGSTLNLSSGGLSIGTTATGNGTYTLSGGTLNAPAGTPTTYVANGGTGTFVQTGGTFNNLGGNLSIGSQAGSVGTYNMPGGTLNNAAALVVGDAGTGTFLQNGGAANISSASGLTLGNTAGSSGTFGLNSGNLTVAKVTGGAGTSTFNFNGGTLQPTGSSTTFLAGLTSAVVQAGGATFNTSAFNVTVGQPLLHDPALPQGTTDGGLTKLGSGTLTLIGANTFTGPTTVSAGTLRLNGSIAGGAAAVAVQSGATLGGSGSIGNGANALTVLSGGTIKPGADDSTVGNLSTGSEVWNGGGTLSIKVGGTGTAVTSADHLILSGLTVTSSSSSKFNLTVTGLSTNTVTPVLTVGGKIVLAVNTSAAADNPFNASGSAPVNLAAFNLTVSGLSFLPGTYALSTSPDTLGLGGYDLNLIATPEPTALLLAGLAAAPLALARRRRKH